ncbi:MAG TPA: hypothetical protein VK701_05750 [Solirubrobacteraceae bacterium]|nr:hypothetical protein [Solirubrobacteraceae bacterium]
MKRLLVLSSVRWGFLWQRHHALATAAAQDGWSVDFVDPPLRGPRHLAGALMTRLRGHERSTIDNPRHERISLIQPPPILSVLGERAKLRYLRGALHARYDACIVYLPDPAMVDFANGVADKLVYDEVVDWENAPASWYPPKRHAMAELAMRGRGWVRITDSSGVAQRNAERCVECVVVPPAADEPFTQHVWAPPVPGGPIVYFGAVRKDEIDVDLLCMLAETGQTVGVIGPVVENSAARRLNAAGVECSGTMPAAQLPAAIDASSALILPYASSREATLVPAKLWNCLATNRAILVRGMRLPDGLDRHFVELPEADIQALGTAQAVASSAPARRPFVEEWRERWAVVVREMQRGE